MAVSAAQIEHRNIAAQRVTRPKQANILCDPPRDPKDCSPTKEHTAVFIAVILSDQFSRWVFNIAREGYPASQPKATIELAHLKFLRGRPLQELRQF